MPRPLNQKCLACSALAISESRGNSCWVEGKCNNTRNYYRSRDKKLKSKQQSYAIAVEKVLPTEWSIVPDSFRAELILYGRQPNKMGLVKGGVKGFKVFIYRGSNIVSQSNLVSCSGMVQADLESAIDQALEQVQELYQIKTWGEIIWKLPIKQAN